MADPARLILIPPLWLLGALSLAFPRLSFDLLDRLAARLPDDPAVGPTAVFEGPVNKEKAS